MGERVVIDKGGRIVIPKPMRERLGFVEGDLLILEEQDGDLVVRHEIEESGLVERGGRFVKPAARGARKTTREETQEMIEAMRLRGAPQPPSKDKKRRAS